MQLHKFQDQHINFNCYCCFHKQISLNWMCDSFGHWNYCIRFKLLILCEHKQHICTDFNWIACKASHCVIKGNEECLPIWFTQRTQIGAQMNCMHLERAQSIWMEGLLIIMTEILNVAISMIPLDHTHNRFHSSLSFWKTIDQFGFDCSLNINAFSAVFGFASLWHDIFQ